PLTLPSKRRRASSQRSWSFIPAAAPAVIASRKAASRVALSGEPRVLARDAAQCRIHTKKMRPRFPPRPQRCRNGTLYHEILANFVIYCILSRDRLRLASRDCCKPETYLDANTSVTSTGSSDLSFYVAP